MGQVSDVLRRTETGYAHWCPGCEEMHVLPDSWTFNGDVNRPTFHPSFLHSLVARELEEGVWTGDWKRDADGALRRIICHYHLIDGQLQFCADSVHALAGKTVPLPSLPKGLRDE